MSNFRRNFLNALEGKPPREEGSLNPNNLYYPYLKTSELPADTQFKIRVMPRHPERNPKGYVEVIRWSLKMPDGSTVRVHCPTMWGEDPWFETVLEAAGAYLFANPSAREKFNQNAAAVEASKDFSKPWVQAVIPVLIYADCDEEKNARGYTDFKNYRPSQTNILTRTLQVNKTQVISQALIPGLDSEDENPDPDHVPINDPQIGIWLWFQKNSDFKNPVSIRPVPKPSPLPKDILEKLDQDYNNCNLIEKEVVKYIRTADEIRALFEQSVVGQALQQVGFTLD